MKLLKIISVLTAVLLGAALCTQNAGAENKPAPIKNAGQLLNISPDGNYYLACDIDLTDTEWKPVMEFSGSLDGRNHEIKGLTSEGYGLFAALDSGAVIKNVRLIDVYIESRFKTVGGIAAYIRSGSDAVIDNCAVTGVVASCMTKNDKSFVGSAAGGIVGKNNSRNAFISNCYSNAIVGSERTAGGITGINYGTVTGCAFDGTLINPHNVSDFSNGEESISYSYALGGICGFNYGTIKNCLGNVREWDSATYFGGITGVLQKGGTVEACVNASYIPEADSIDDNFIPGGHIAGYAAKSSTLKNCYTIKAESGSVTNDVGKGKTDTVTYTVSREKFNKISSFKRLGEGWKIVGDVPFPISVSDMIGLKNSWTIINERLVHEQ